MDISKIFDIIEARGPYTVAVSLLTSTVITLIYIKVFMNFRRAKELMGERKTENKSVVETLSMSLFFLLCYVVIMTKLGNFSIDSIYYNILIGVSFVTMIIGAYFNLMGRVNLGDNWGNNVVIYKTHTLVRTGVYGIVRHPLYASIIWMLYAIGILYFNYLIIILNTVIFIPFMYYRAKQEESALVKVFDDYNKYQKEVGMFFPKLWRTK